MLHGADGDAVLLLHGQPSWSYLYRHMIPILADAGSALAANRGPQGLHAFTLRANEPA